MRGDTIYNTHSPFLFELAQYVLKDNNKRDQRFETVHQLKRFYTHSNLCIDFQDLGAGSHVSHNNKRKLKEIAKSTAIPSKYGRLLHRLVNWGELKNIIELGTGTGISTAYLALSEQSKQIVTIDGAAELIDFVEAQLQEKLPEAAKIEFHKAAFDELLPELLKEISSIDLLIVDGNHKKEATLRYFNMVLPSLHPHSVVVFDDIRWSIEMKAAWEQIKLNPAVSCSIDLFRMGLIFFRKELLKPQHVIFKY